MTKNPKKLRKLLRDGQVSINELPVEKMRGRHVREMLVVANSILKEMAR